MKRTVHAPKAYPMLEINGTERFIENVVQRLDTLTRTTPKLINLVDRQSFKCQISAQDFDYYHDLPGKKHIGLLDVAELPEEKDSCPVKFTATVRLAHELGHYVHDSSLCDALEKEGGNIELYGTEHLCIRKGDDIDLLEAVNTGILGWDDEQDCLQENGIAYPGRIYQKAVSHEKGLYAFCDRPTQRQLKQAILHARGSTENDVRRNLLKDKAYLDEHFPWHAGRQQQGTGALLVHAAKRLVMGPEKSYQPSPEDILTPRRRYYSTKANNI